MKARLWFVHKGIEKLFEGHHYSTANELAERISGDTAVGHNLAYCLAVEDALDIRVPPAGHYLRALLLELERLYNHAADIGALTNDVGYSILNSHALRIREQLLRLNRRVTGHRLLRGGIVVGRRARPRTSRHCRTRDNRRTTSPKSRTSHSPTKPSSTGSPAPPASTPKQQQNSASSVRSPRLRHQRRRPPRPPLHRPLRPTRGHRRSHRRRTSTLLPPTRRIRRVNQPHQLAPRPARTPPPRTRNRTDPRTQTSRLRRRTRRSMARNHRPPSRNRTRRQTHSSQDRRPVILQLARTPPRTRRHHRPRLPPHQQELQPLLRRQRPLNI